MRIALAIAALLSLSACSTAKSERAQVYYYGLQGGAADTAGMHTAGPQDTPWTIAKDYRLPVQEVIAVNHLQAPYKLRPGQRVILPPPASYETKPGDTLYSISRTFNVSTTQLAQLNDLREPFAVLPGQTLRLPSERPVARTVPMARTTQMASARAAHLLNWRNPAGNTPPPQVAAHFVWPANGPVISSYGPKAGGLHNDGINIRAPRGAPVQAAAGGTVVYAGNELKGFGNLVLLRHDGRWMTAYAHMDRLNVRRGQKVGQGDVIGAIGSTGSADSPQLHFEIRHGTEALDPLSYLRGQGA